VWFAVFLSSLAFPGALHALAPGCDQDGDGWLSAACGGTDCDDSSDAIHPGAPDAVDGSCEDWSPDEWITSELAFSSLHATCLALVVEPDGLVHTLALNHWDYLLHLLPGATQSYPPPVHAGCPVAAWTPWGWLRVAFLRLVQDEPPQVVVADLAEGEWLEQAVPVFGARLAFDGQAGLHAVGADAEGRIRYQDPSGATEFVPLPQGTELADEDILAFQLDSQDRAHLVVQVPESFALLHATNRDGSWALGVVDPMWVPQATAGGVAMAMDAAGAAHVAYSAWPARVLTHATNRGGAWARTVVDPSAPAGYPPRMVVDARGRVSILYKRLSSMNVALATDRGNGWVVNPVDFLGDGTTPWEAYRDLIDLPTALALGPGDRLVAAYARFCGKGCRGNHPQGWQWPVRVAIEAGCASLGGAEDRDCDGVDGTDLDHDGEVGVAWGGPDCVDTDPTVAFGAADPAGDKLDTNCDGADGTDRDGDGYQAGGDCDDADPAVNPAAQDFPEGTCLRHAWEVEDVASFPGRYLEAPLAFAGGVADALAVGVIEWPDETPEFDSELNMGLPIPTFHLLQRTGSAWVETLTVQNTLVATVGGGPAPHRTHVIALTADTEDKVWRLVHYSEQELGNWEFEVVSEGRAGCYSVIEDPLGRTQFLRVHSDGSTVTAERMLRNPDGTWIAIGIDAISPFPESLASWPALRAEPSGLAHVLRIGQSVDSVVLHETAEGWTAFATYSYGHPGFHPFDLEVDDVGQDVLVGKLGSTYGKGSAYYLKNPAADGPLEPVEHPHGPLDALEFVDAIDLARCSGDGLCVALRGSTDWGYADEVRFARNVETGWVVEPVPVPDLPNAVSLAIDRQDVPHLVTRYRPHARLSHAAMTDCLEWATEADTNCDGVDGTASGRMP
jgi:hypothetical protein